VRTDARQLSFLEENKMRSIKKFITALMLGLALVITSAAFAQEAQSDPVKKESCCAMSSCCKGDSCPMKKQAKDHAKKHSAKDGRCCCSGDSCEMKMKDMKEDKAKNN
jgi:hypothetical protein